MTVLVFGSINMDLVTRSPRLPRPGETITGTDFFTAPGGKGANQAVAAARLTLPTRMVGRVGADDFGTALLTHLAEAGVDTTAVQQDPQTTSGVALIAVDDAAQNNIIVIPGANGKVGPNDVARLEPHLKTAQLLLLQLEIPLTATMAAARLAQQHGVTVMLDPAPVQPLPAELFPMIDIITPNEVEVSQLVGFEVQTINQASAAVQHLFDLGTPNIVITMGALGVVYATQAEPTPQFIPAFEVESVDSTAAGDAFNGALAWALLQKNSDATMLVQEETIRFAAAAAALATLKPGAQPAMPTLQAVQQFLIEHPHGR